MRIKCSNYFTPPILYANDVPRVGHAHTQKAVDSFTRFSSRPKAPTHFVARVYEHSDQIPRTTRSRVDASELEGGIA